MRIAVVELTNADGAVLVMTIDETKLSNGGVGSYHWSLVSLLVSSWISIQETEMEGKRVVGGTGTNLSPPTRSDFGKK